MEFLIFLFLFVVLWLVGWSFGKMKLNKQMPKGEDLQIVMESVYEKLEQGCEKEKIYSYLKTKGIGKMVGDIIIDSASIFCFPNSDRAKKVEKMVAAGKPRSDVLLYLAAQGFDKETGVELYETLLLGLDLDEGFDATTCPQESPVVGE